MESHTRALITLKLTLSYLFNDLSNGLVFSPLKIFGF